MSPNPDVPIHSDITDRQRRVQRVTENLRTTYRAWTYHSFAEAPKTLLEALQRNLPHIDPHSWPERLDFGGVYINGRDAHTDQPLPSPCRVEYYEPKFDISAAASIFPVFEERYLIYHDGDIAVAWKPPKLSSMPAKEQRHFSLKASLEKLLGTPIHMPSRLDVSAQGLVIVSTSPRAHRELQHSFQYRRVTKTYLCASSSLCTWRETIISAPIGRDPLHPVLRMTNGIAPQDAETHFTVLSADTSDSTAMTIFRARPITGRTHQIRVHAQHAGVALCGDTFYGGAVAPHLHLVSCAIQCLHPVTRREFLITLPAELQPDWVRQYSF